MDEKDDDLIALSPSQDHPSILKASMMDDLMLLETPVNKRLKVSFETPARTPLGSIEHNAFHYYDKADCSSSMHGPESQSTDGNKWALVQKLDESLNWKDRTEPSCIQVVTRIDHEDYTDWAKEVLCDIVETAMEDSHPEGQGEIDKAATDGPVQQESNQNVFLIPQLPNVTSQKKSLEPAIPQQLHNQFAATKCLPNTPDKVKDPFAATQCLPNTPDKGKDPFAATQCLPNTPDQVKDPFASTKCLPNTPDQGKDPFAATQCLPNTPDQGKDPFATAKCLPNTPDQVKDPFATTKCLPNTPDQVKDPFATTKCLPNTPDQGKDPFAATKCLPNTPDQGNDPFATTKCLPNDPDQENDPFAPTIRLFNAPDQENDPFASIKCLANAPDQENDPFAAFKCNPNTEDQGQDPFATGDCIPASQERIQESGETTGFDFKTPEKVKDPFSNLACKDEILSGSPSALISSSISRRKILQTDVTNPPEEFSAFKNAADLVSDGFDFGQFDFDYLESKGKNANSRDLRKQSLYVCFDPLVSDSPNTAHRRTTMGRKSDIIDFSESRRSLARSRLAKISDTTTPPPRQPDILCDSPSTIQDRLRESNEPSRKRIAVSSPEPQSSECVSEEVLVEIATYTRLQLQQAAEDGKLSMMKQMEELQATIADQNKQLQAEKKLRTQVEANKDAQMAELLAEMDKSKDDFYIKIEKMGKAVKLHETNSYEICFAFKSVKENSESKKEKLSKEVEMLKSQLDSVEKAHMGLWQRSKNMEKNIEAFKKNEILYKETFEIYQTKHAEVDKLYQELKISSEQQISSTMEESKKREQSLTSHTNANKIKVRSLESQLKSLQATLEQKQKECSELSQICEEMIQQQTK